MFRTYDKYKEIGVEWIGRIPSHWMMSKVKYEFGVKGGGTPSKENSEYWGGSIPWISPKDMKSNLISDSIDKITELGLINSSTNLVQEGSLLMVVRSGILQHTIPVGINVLPVSINQDLKSFSSRKGMFVKYFLYFIQGNQDNLLLEWSKDGTTVESIEMEFLENSLTPMPPVPEQDQIVSFLDKKTALIDSLIEKTQRKIELLKEQRTSLINEVVTKGLNPDVDMKDSGVEWIGEIPSHWIESQFKHYIKLRHGHQFRDYDFSEFGIKIVKITQLHKNGYLDLSNCSTVNSDRLDEFKDIIINENDVLMCLTGGTIGKTIKVGSVQEPLLQNYRVGHFSPLNNTISNDFLYYLMSSEVIIGQILFDVRETGQPNIGLDDMNRMRVCIPPINEQQEIVEYLDNETQLIDRTISNEEKRIELLKEYRQSLISEVVTGKVKVPGV